MKIPRSTHYYLTKEKDPQWEKGLLARIEEIVIEFPKYGYRRVTKQLHREEWMVNRKVILNLMRSHGLLCKKKRKFVVHTTDSNHPYPIYPNLVKGFAAANGSRALPERPLLVTFDDGYADLADVALPILERTGSRRRSSRGRRAPTACPRGRRSTSSTTCSPAPTAARPSSPRRASGCSRSRPAISSPTCSCSPAT